MNTSLQTSLTSLETALTTLIDSITSYNPSLAAAQDLLTADDDLTQNLHRLSTHQANHQRILSLRNTAASLDESIRSTLTLLAETRQEILATPATSFPPNEQRRPIPYAELMNYAKNIARYTAPPPSGLRPPTPEPLPPADPSTQISELQTQQPSQLSNGTSISSFPLPSQEPQPPPSLEPPPSTSTTTNPALLTLTSPEKQWLDPLTHTPFTPWPSEEMIRSGALAQIQAMLERGEDPGEFRGGDEQKVGGEGGGDRMEGVVVENGDGDGDGDRDARRSSVALPVVGRAREREREEKPVVFGGLDLYDPDED